MSTQPVNPYAKSSKSELTPLPPAFRPEKPTPPQSMNGEVIKFIYKRNSWKKKDDGKEITHLFLNGQHGGTVSIADEDAEEFLKIYARDAVNKKHSYIVERRTQVFRLLVDFDIMDTKEIDITKITDYAILFQKVTKRFYPNESPETFKAVVCMAPSKQVIQNTGEHLIKTGVHINFPNLLVTDEHALLIRQAVLADFQGLYSGREHHNAWAEVIDESVYGAAGLRPVFSSKVEKCPECKNVMAAKQNCCKCMSKGKIDAGRCYLPIQALDGEGVPDVAYLNELMTDVYRLVTDTSIRAKKVKAVVTATTTTTTHQKTGFVEPKTETVTTFTCPPPTSTFARPIGSPSYLPFSKGTKKLPGGVQLVNFPNDPKQKKSAKEIPEQSVRYPIILGIVRKYNNIYKDIEVKSMTETGSGKTRKVSVRVRPGSLASNFCLNKNGDHNSNTIWFSLTYKGVGQRCWSPHSHNGVVCKDFCSPVTRIDGDVVDVIFPGAVQKTTAANRKMSPTGSGGATKKMKVDRRDGSTREIERTLLALRERIFAGGEHGGGAVGRLLRRGAKRKT